MRQLTLSAAIFGLTIIPKYNSAQPQGTAPTKEIPSNHKIFDSIVSNIRLNEISPRAYRHFQMNYPSVDRARWIRTTDGFVVVFMEGDSFNETFYDSSGRFLYSVMSDSPDLLEQTLNKKTA
jgi:hypothetical protein